MNFRVNILFIKQTMPLKFSCFYYCFIYLNTMAMASVCSIIPPLLFVNKGGSNKNCKLHDEKHLYSVFFFGFKFQVSKMFMGPLPLAFLCLCLFLCVFEYVVLDERSSPLCVQSLPSPFLDIYKGKNLMFNIVWCKTTIAELYEGF
jgi:hypothetical protein